MCDRKSLNTRAASAVVCLPVRPSHYPGGSCCEESMNQNEVDCCPRTAEDVVISSQERIVVAEEESIFERVKKKLRQATMIGSPSRSLDRRSSNIGTGVAKPVKKTRHSWHQETT